jgi:hypothetical protein
MTDDARTTEALRRMVREVLQEVLPRDSAAPAAAPAAPSVPDVRRVRVRDDRDLADLVARVLDLAEDPARVADLRSGRLRFALAEEHPSSPRPAQASADAPADGPLDVVRGAVTERLVQRAAREHRGLRLGPRAVLTPLARDRARALGVAIERREAP